MGWIIAQLIWPDSVVDPEGFIPDASPDPAMNLKSSGYVYVSIL